MVFLLLKEQSAHSASQRRTSAFSLVEIMLAVGILAIVIIPLVALLSLGMRQNQESIEDTLAAGIAESVAADLKGASFSASGEIFQAASGTVLERFFDRNGTLMGKTWSEATGATGGGEPFALTRITIGDLSPSELPAELTPGSAVFSTVNPASAERPQLRAGAIEMFWPLDQASGAPLNPEPRKAFTVYLSKRTDPSW